MLFNISSSLDKFPPIHYGNKFQLLICDNQVVLHGGNDSERVVGMVTPDGDLMITAAEFLALLLNTDDARYFTNGSLRLAEINCLSSGLYSVDRRDPVSIHPPEYRFDISFWLPEKSFSTTDYLLLVFRISKHLVREVTLLDIFTCDGRTSHCYSIIYQSLDGALSYAHAYALYQSLRQESAEVMRVGLR